MMDKKRIWLIDSTLRDGEQAPGVAFSRKEKIRLACMLDEIGIDEIEAGIPVMNEEVSETIRQMTQLHLKSRILVWSRAVLKDIELSALTHAESIHIAFPISSIQLSTMNKSWQWVEDSIPELVTHAKRFFKHVSVGAQDASRSDIDQLRKFVTIALEAGAERIRVADTVGVLTPMTAKSLLENVLSFSPGLDVDFHAHNDLGMATANAITAWQSGADSLSVTVNGLGERAGNAALEEVLMALCLNSEQTKYNTSLLYSLCRYVSDISKRPIPMGKAISGKMAFSHESGIHTRSTLKNTIAFQAFDGKIIGRESYRNIFGKHSGSGALRHFLDERNIVYDNDKLALLKKKVFNFSQQNKREMFPEEVIEAFVNLAYN